MIWRASQASGRSPGLRRRNWIWLAARGTQFGAHLRRPRAGPVAREAFEYRFVTRKARDAVSVAQQQCSQISAVYSVLEKGMHGE